MNSLQIKTCDELFYKCPTATAIFNSKSLKLEHANPAILDIWGRDDSVIGLTILEFLPEVESQGYPELLRMVGDSDKAYSEQGAEVKLVKEGVLQSVFMDFNYTPIKEAKRIPVGILVTANELSEKYINTLSGQEYERNLRSLVLAAPVPMCIFRGQQLFIEVVNGHMLDLWQREEYRNLKTIRHVFHTGQPINFAENNISYSCTALRNEQGTSVGCVLMAIGTT